ncbi:MAG: hypothetical protein EA417_18085 [Gammaproteobacteria bacterium]|nr:MAG: hypothetical protein EA417_18085 [Gammaproteobacteria bacterium]
MIKLLMPWVVALVAYGLFVVWYQNWRAPLTEAEVSKYRGLLEASPVAGTPEAEAVVRFLANDDGRAFLMVNLIKLARDPVPDPVTGVARPAADLLEDYSKVFLGAALRRASHPVLVVGKVGGYVDAWNVEADPGWTALGLVRYRSRRDLAELVTMEGVFDAHAFKIAAMPTTFAFPAVSRMSMLLAPQLWVGLVLALLASLASLGLALLRMAH